MTKNTQEAASCDTVNVRPAIDAVPTRAVPVFASELRLTVPFPAPLAPAVMRSHEALLVAVHVQPAPVVTVVVMPPPVLDSV